MIKVRINGEARDVGGGSVTALLEELGLKPQLIVVEYNRNILDRSEFDATEIQAGDNIELVHFVGGG